MKKKILLVLALISFFITIVCMVCYNAIGCEIASDGTLVEPFFLIPLGYLFAAIGIILTTIFMITAVFRKIKKAGQ